jgi:2-keto-4-pentenoate hydratase/2-oxohepta-3-ene-1,7-dioic acid hydratase in catechol pathway
MVLCKGHGMFCEVASDKVSIIADIHQDGFCPLGPCIVSAEQIPDAAILNLKTSLNGKVMQNGSADDMIFSIPEIVSYLSQVWWKVQKLYVLLSSQ